MEVDALVGKKVVAAASGEEHMGCLVVHGWVPDDEARLCMACQKPFTTVRRRVRLMTSCNFSNGHQAFSSL